MATHSSILACRIRWTEEPGGLQSMWSESDTTERLTLLFGVSQVALVVKNPPTNAGDLGSMPGLGRSPGDGNGNPLQYSCLENPMDRGAWWVTVHGVSKSWTRLRD